MGHIIYPSHPTGDLSFWACTAFINMSQERRQDYNTVINDVAILMGCMDPNDERWVYIEEYDGYTRSFETIALSSLHLYLDSQ